MTRFAIVLRLCGFTFTSLRKRVLLSLTSPLNSSMATPCLVDDISRSYYSNLNLKNPISKRPPKMSILSNFLNDNFVFCKINALNYQYLKLKKDGLDFGHCITIFSVSCNNKALSDEYYSCRKRVLYYHTVCCFQSILWLMLTIHIP